MRLPPGSSLASLACLALLGAAPASAQEAVEGGDPGNSLQAQIDAQVRRLGEMRRDLDLQEQDLARLQQALDEQRLTAARGRGAGPAQVAAGAQAAAGQGAAGQGAAGQGAAGQASADQATPVQPIGRAPESASRPPEVAQIFDQPGVLTPAGRFVLEPSLQYGYWSNDRVALVGYTIIPALLIGLIDVRQVKTSTGIATLTGRYGITNRLELEARVPYNYVSADTVSREVFTGTAVDNVFNARGDGLGDVELTARYQLNQGGADRPFFVGWLRYKSRTGTDLFEVVTDCVTRCVGNTTGTGLPLELPTGSGFEAIQPGVTWLFPSDPVVFFGSLSYLHNFERSNVSRTVIGGQTEFLGDVDAGDIIGVNIGMGLALNEKAAISIGLEQNFIGKTQLNGEDAAGSVRLTLATLLLGGSYRFNERVSLNVVLGAGVTRDTPDMTFTTRVPITF